MCPIISMKEKELTTADLPLSHPYTRYGLAVALIQNKLQRKSLSEKDLCTALIYSIEVGLENFRMKTNDSPAYTCLLKFAPIPFADLISNQTLVGSSGLADKGIYIFPTVLTTDLQVKKAFASATSILTQLRDQRQLSEKVTFSRSFAPTTAKINNKKSSQSAPKGTLLEAACALVTTLTPCKPAA